MKNLVITLALILGFSFSAAAQYDFPQWGVGVFGGSARPFSDMKQNDYRASYGLRIFWNYSPYLPFVLEAQKGRLSGGNIVTDAHKRAFVNNYTAFDLHANLQLGEVVDFQGRPVLERLKGFYSGVGIGVMMNKLSFVQRFSLNDPTYEFPGQDASSTLLIPLRFGYEFKIFDYYDMPFMAIDLNYTHYLTFAEGMDGYDDPNVQFKNNAQDMFSSFNVGIRLNFGGTRLYTKPVR